jgi:hypothetical protein
MGHCSHQSIRATKSHITGLEELENKKMESNLDCASCMVGKATLQPYPHRKERASRPLERVHLDLLSGGVLVTSLEGHNHAIVITDDATMFRWVYGLKTKDDANAMIRKWVSDISDIREHPIKIIIRDNAGEFRSKDKMNLWSVSARRTISQLLMNNGRMVWLSLR